MVQSVGSLTDILSLVRTGAGRNTGSSTGTDPIAALLGLGQASAVSGSSATSTATTTQGGTSSSGNGSASSTGASASTKWSGSQTKTIGRRDFDNAFQHLSSDLQSVMVSAQAAAGDAQAAGSTVAASLGSSTALASTMSSLTQGAAAQSSGLPVPATFADRQTDAASGQHHHHDGGNWALEGDSDALLNDMHGLVQVANGDISSQGVTGTGTARAASAGTASTTTGATASPTAPSSTEATTMTAFGFAQNLMQAMGAYGNSTAANGRSSVVEAIG
jgi:hypothetical protein